MPLISYNSSIRCEEIQVSLIVLLLFPEILTMNFLLKIIFFLCLLSSISCTVTLVRDLVQFNVFGHPFLHTDTKWNFDPEAGKRRARQYQQLNGFHGERAIERLGLGIDGYDAERREEQRERDKGHLGGVNYIAKEFL